MMKILIVDDDSNKSKNIELIVKEILAPDKLYIKQAQNISEANKALSDSHYDLMLLDLNLPMRNNSVAQSDAGIKFLHQLGRQNNMNTPTHIIGLTAFDGLLTEHQIHFQDRGWVLVKYEQNSDGWEGVIKEKIYHILDSSPNKKAGLFSGVKYLLIFIVLLVVLLLVWVLLGMKEFLVFIPIVIIAFYAICLLQLLNENKLTEKSFKALTIEILKALKSDGLNLWSHIFSRK